MWQTKGFRYWEIWQLKYHMSCFLSKLAGSLPPVLRQFLNSFLFQNIYRISRRSRAYCWIVASYTYHETYLYCHRMPQWALKYYFVKTRPLYQNSFYIMEVSCHINYRSYFVPVQWMKKEALVLWDGFLWITINFDQLGCAVFISGGRILCIGINHIPYCS